MVGGFTNFACFPRTKLHYNVTVQISNSGEIQRVRQYLSRERTDDISGQNLSSD